MVVVSPDHPSRRDKKRVQVTKKGKGFGVFYGFRVCSSFSTRFFAGSELCTSAVGWFCWKTLALAKLLGRDVSLGDPA